MARIGHALDVIEFTRVLELIATRAVSGYGAEKVLQLVPRTELAWIREELARVESLRDLLRDRQHWRVKSIPDLRAVLRRLAVAGTTLDGRELRDISALLVSSRLALDQLHSGETPTSTRNTLAQHAAALLSDPASERIIERSIGDDGTVNDHASAALKRIRRELAGQRDQIVSLLERIVSSLEPHQRLPDASVTIRDGRYVIPIRREAKGNVGGIVHDTSATGGTLFVEPPAAIEHGNRVRELESDERREVERILLELTESIRPKHASLIATLESLAELDSLMARAIFAESFGGSSVEVVEPKDGFSIHNGRHPLLMSQGIDVVPFSLEMTPAERTLLISGPNTGGKTVLLKSVAIISAMVQSGLPVPVAAESRVAVFDEFFADVGDEQSIEASLSTFSAHLRNILDILSNATPRSLVLMDEIGSGTDPIEGAALAAAVLEELTQRGTTTLATTHLGALQRLATEAPGVVNASLQFDAVKLEPTYNFIKGIPGRSYGLSIARRLGLPAAIMENAERRVPEGEKNLAALIAALETRERELASREETAARDAAEVTENARRIADREMKLRERQREFEVESRKGARRHLLDSREEVEKTIRELRSAGAADVENAARSARRRIEELAADHDARLHQLEETTAEYSAAGDPAGIGVGDAVTVSTLGAREGTVLELRGDAAVVSVGSMKVTAPLGVLSKAGRGKREVAEPIPVRGELPEERVSSEIDIRGMRVDEVDRVLIPALDEAARADMRSFRIIHGKGTGALRSRVQEILARDARVASHRSGAWNEGGAGVTLVELS